MSQEIHVSFIQEGDVYTVRTGHPVLKDIVMDYTGIPEDERDGASSVLLIASALSCYCGSLRAALVSRGAVPRSLAAAGTGFKEPDANGAMRLRRIDIDVAVDLAGEYEATLAHCAKVVKQCLITASLFEGIEVSHSIRKA